MCGLQFSYLVILSLNCSVSLKKFLLTTKNLTKLNIPQRLFIERIEKNNMLSGKHLHKIKVNALKVYFK